MSKIEMTAAPVFLDFEQYSPEWYENRLGKVSASRIADILAKSKTGYAANREERHTERVPKRDQILMLLRRRDGATIPEMMEVSGWQQHSVRGFLAGTVKKKMSLALVSSKADGDVRRYRIAPRRGR
ncbi:MAG TPA: DUF3489 domain-containing protein [Hyphomicrobium sp.]|nr:DUF3489 domain-containing protein [Hyphomicrobium sp.]